MGGSADVRIKSGEQPRYFGWPPSGALSTTVNGASLPVYKEAPRGAFQAILTGSGACTATITIVGTNENLTGQGTPIGRLSTTASSTTLTSAGGDFFPNGLDPGKVTISPGMLIVGPGIPVGTTITSITNPTTLVMSAAATATASNINLAFFNLNWLSTVLGTITLSGTPGTGSATGITDGFVTVATWRFIRAVVSSLTGTGATVQVIMGV